MSRTLATRPTQPADARGPPRAMLVALGLLCALHGAWPGDVQFVNDEPLLIANALQANEQGTLVTRGLPGSHGAFYGPLPTWLYQLWTSR